MNIQETETLEEKIINIPASEEDLILGKSDKKKQVKVVDCFNKELIYEVTNLESKNKPTLMNGVMVKNFFGFYSANEKKTLEEGKKEVIILDTKREKKLYKIKLVK